MKKTLYIVTKSNFGGAQRYVFDLATSLPSNEYQVTVAAGGNGILFKRLQEVGIKTYSIETFQRDISFIKELRSLKELFNLYRKEKPDIVHLNSSKAGGTGAFVARLCGIKKVIFTVHGFAFNEDRPWYQKILIMLAHYVTLLLCTNVIFISKKEFDQAKKWPFIKNKLHLIYNGINPPHFLSRDDARMKLAEHIGKPISFFEGKKVIGSIGELTKNKGYTYAIDAIKNIPNTIYIIIGDGEIKENLSTHISHTQQNTTVFLAGYITNASSILKAFDIFLISSIKEGIPYVLLEAGLASLPVITTNVGGIPEIIDTTNGILIPPFNSKAIEEALSANLHSPESIKYATLLNNKIHKQLSLSAMVKQTQAIYNN